MRIHSEDLLFSVTFFKYWAALATLSTFDNGGVVGSLGCVSACIMSFIENNLVVCRLQSKLFFILLSMEVFFTVEIIQKKLNTRPSFLEYYRMQPLFIFVKPLDGIASTK